MALKDLVGQPQVTKLLLDALKRREIDHAYLFAGPPGTGKEAAAVSFARGVLCGQGGDACGNCCHCRKAGTQNHPDIAIIRADGTSIKIEQIRRVLMDIALKPLEAEFKIYIIPEAEKMTLQAANCLLKTLEEPPSYAVIILLTAKPEAILPTVVSRCQFIRFTRVSEEVIRGLLRGQGKGEAEAALLAAFADGSAGRALALAQTDYLERWAGIVEMAERLVRQGEYEAVAAVHKLEKDVGREEMLDLLLFFYRDLLVWQETRERGLLIGFDQAAVYERLSGSYRREELLALIERIEKTKLLLQQNINPGLALEMLVLEMAGPGQ
ncbi:MAG: DNA polymerase III subunit delta' [bacterium]|jgi:DNA polymerase-3 subunit delta'